MTQHDREATKNQADRSTSDIFRFPTRAEMQKAQSPQLEPEKSKPIDRNYQDEDLSGCLSGFLKPKQIEPQQSQRSRFTPTKRDLTTGEISQIDRDDLSGANEPLDEEKSGWLYFD
jgi:hypothetical protein